MNIEEKLRELNASLKGDYWIVTCPSCGHKEAFIYLDDVEKAKESPKHKIPIRCNRLRKCGKTNYIEDVKVNTIPKIKEEDIVGISQKAITKINDLAYLNYLLKDFDFDWRGISNQTLKDNGVIYLKKGLIDFMRGCGKDAFADKFFIKRCYEQRDILIPIKDYDGNCQRLLLRSTQQLDDKAKKEISMRLYKKSSEVWNRRDLINPDMHCVFATEGVPDGLSIKEVSQKIGVVSLPGVRKYKQILKEIDKHKKAFGNKKIIIAFDNDEAGLVYMKAFQSQLEERQIPFAIFDLHGYKDANDFLQKDRKLFFESVAEAANIKPKSKKRKLKGKQERAVATPAEDLIKKVGVLHEKKKLILRTCKQTIG